MKRKALKPSAIERRISKEIIKRFDALTDHADEAEYETWKASSMCVSNSVKDASRK